MTTQQTFLDQDIDTLFDLIEHVCTDCAQPFRSSARAASYCALCASLRKGQVGPATVQCPACGLEHQVPVLAPHKLCRPCAADPELTAHALRARLEAAEAALDAATTRLDADLAHADAPDQARYEAAVEARGRGLWKGEARTPTFFAQQWAAAIARGDGLAPLLAARLAYDDAGAQWQAAQRQAEAGLAEVERARE